jgi:hypothetical protein
MPETVTIPISYFELLAQYDDPDIGTAMDRRHVITALYNALKPWNINIDDVEVITTGKLSEQGVKFKLPQHRITFFYGPVSFKFTQDGASWDTADLSLGVLNAAVAALAQTGDIEIAAYKTTIALHIQPKTVNFFEITKQFVPHQISAIEIESPKTVASVVVWENRRITIDGSGSVANALFVRLERDFGGHMGFTDMAVQLRKDEGELFGILNIEEERL